MKLFLPCIVALLISASCAAQVFTFTPEFHAKITHSGRKDYNEMWFHGVDVLKNKTFTIDIDKKTIAIPNDHYPEGRIMPIAAIVREKDNGRIILKMEADKDIGVVWSYYQLKLDEQGSPVELQLVERLTGKRFSRDTFIEMYTNDLRSLMFYKECKRIKSDMSLSADEATSTKQLKAVSDAPSTEGYNTLEMRDGYVYWTEGKGKNAIRHILKIDKVDKLKDARAQGVLIRCSNADEAYGIMYLGYCKGFEPGILTPLNFFTLTELKYEVPVSLRMIR